MCQVTQYDYLVCGGCANRLSAELRQLGYVLDWRMVRVQVCAMCSGNPSICYALYAMSPATVAADACALCGQPKALLRKTIGKHGLLCDECTQKVHHSEDSVPK